METAISRRTQCVEEGFEHEVGEKVDARSERRRVAAELPVRVHLTRVKLEVKCGRPTRKWSAAGRAHFSARSPLDLR